MVRILAAHGDQVKKAFIILLMLMGGLNGPLLLLPEKGGHGAHAHKILYWEQILALPLMASAAQ